MSITSVGWNTDQVIQINKADMTLIQSTPVEIYRLDTDQFFLDLKDEERSVDGMPWTDTQRNSSPVSLGGVTYARVLEIIDPYTITFEDDQYIVQLVGSNNNIIEKTNPNQVSIQGNNSAGLIQVDELQYAAYQGGVWVDVVGGEAGQSYPIGTAARPVDNMVDALFIAEFRGFDTFFITSDLTVPSGSDFTDKAFVGQSPARSSITVAAGNTITGVLFRNARLTGALPTVGDVEVRDCTIDTLANMRGSFIKCGFEGSCSLVDAAGAELIDCHSEVPGGVNTVILDVGNSELVVRNYSGGLEIQGKDGTAAVSMDFHSGQCIINDNCSAGEITMRGVAKWTNRETYVGTTVVDDEFVTAAQLQQVWKILGLDKLDPVDVTPSGVDSDSGDIDINFTGDGVTLTRMERQ